MREFLPKATKILLKRKFLLAKQALVNPPVIMDGQKREAFLNLTQIMGAQGQSLTTQAQAIRAQVNWEVAPHVNQNYSTSHLRHFTRMITFEALH